MSFSNGNVWFLSLIKLNSDEDDDAGDDNDYIDLQSADDEVKIFTKINHKDCHCNAHFFKKSKTALLNLDYEF